MLKHLQLQPLAFELLAVPAPLANNALDSVVTRDELGHDQGVVRCGLPAVVLLPRSGTIPNHGSRALIIQQTFRGSFSAVSKPILQVILILQH